MSHDDDDDSAVLRDIRARDAKWKGGGNKACSDRRVLLEYITELEAVVGEASEAITIATIKLSQTNKWASLAGDEEEG